MLDLEGLQKEPVYHEELVKATAGHMGKNYSKKVVKEVLCAYVQMLHRALGTGRPVKVAQLGVIQIGLKRPRAMEISQYKYERQEPINLTPKLRINANGRMAIRKALFTLNHVKNLDDKSKPIELVPKRQRT